MSTEPKYVGLANNKGLAFLNADGTDLKDLIVGAANGTKVSIIMFVNEQAAVNQNAELWWNDGVNDFFIVTGVVPQGAGTDGSPPLSLFNEGSEGGLEVDNNGNFFLTLGEGEILKVKMQAAIAGAETVYVTVFAQDY